MKNDKWCGAHLCAYLSLAISLVLMVLWICNVGGFTVVTLDSFVGVIVALLAIIVTLAFTWQIYGVIEIKNKIEEVSELRHKLKIQEEENQRQVFHLNCLVFGSLAETEISRSDYISAFGYLLVSLESDMSSDIPQNAMTILDKMEFAVSKINSKTILNMEKIESSNNVISESKHYNMIKERYEKVYNDFISKVKL